MSLILSNKCHIDCLKKLPRSMSLRYSLKYIIIFNSTVKPDPPQSVMIASKTSRTVTISWKSGFDGNSQISSYTVEFSEDNQTFSDGYCQGLSNSSCRVSGQITNATLEGLHPGRMYYFRVFANNTVGQSEASSVVNATTDEEGTCTVHYKHTRRKKWIYAKFAQCKYGAKINLLRRKP